MSAAKKAKAEKTLADSHTAAAGQAVPGGRQRTWR